MKKVIEPILFLIMVTLYSCGNSNAGAKNSNTENNTASQKTESASTTNASDLPYDPSNEIVGNWTLALECYDDNDNRQLDPEERAKAFSNHYFYRFNADGSCVFGAYVTNQLKSGFKGHYELKKNNSKQTITTFWDETEEKGNQEAQYTIVSLGKEELVLLETTGNHTFWIFKRM